MKCPGCNSDLPPWRPGRGRQWTFCSYNCRMRNWRKNNPERIKQHARKTLYGITTEQYELLLSKQGGLCEICKKKSKLVIDHCHASGVVRSLLCGNCNTAIGLLKEDVLTAESVVSYLKRHASE